MKRGFAISERQQRRALDWVTGAMVVSVAVALAGLTWRLAGHAGQGAITVPAGTRAAALPDMTGALAWQPFGQAAQTEQATPTGLQLELKGIVFALPQELAVAYVVEGGGQPRAVRVGEGLSGATIDSIQRDRVLLNNGGRIEYLAFPDPSRPPPSPGSAPAPAPAPAGGGGAPPPPPASPSAANMLQRFDATPIDGGYRIGANGPPGMQAGDVVQSVNGQALGRGPADQAAFAAAQASGSAQIQILRDGKPMTLTVPLR